MAKIIDLTLTIHEGMQTFPTPWHPFVEITQLGRFGIEDRETRKLVIGTHTGTHMDAPRHFIPEGDTVDQIPLSTLVGPASVIDFTYVEPQTEIDLPHFQEVVTGKNLERLIFRFDWDKHLGTMAYYNDHAYFSDEVCTWLVENGCKLIALDTPQPDNPKNGRGAERDAPNHKILLGNGTIIVEYLTNISAISKQEVELVVAPLKIQDGDGAPVRCFVIE